jgi:hypothetical protein
VFPSADQRGTAATAIAAWYVLRGQAMHLRTSDGMRLLGGGVLLAILSAAFGVFALQQTGRLETTHLADAFARWALGDVLGIAVVTPTLLLTTTSRNPEHPLSPLHEGSSVRERLLWIALMATCFLAIHSLGDRGIYVLGLISLPLVLLLWSALRFSAVWTSVAAGVTVLYFSASTVLGLGGFTAPKTLLEATVTGTEYESVARALEFHEIYVPVTAIPELAVHLRRYAKTYADVLARDNEGILTYVNLRVEKIDAERNLIYIRGGVPGARNSVLYIKKA